MFDWIANVRKSAEERREEQITAYIDGELSGPELAGFEQSLKTDKSLQDEVAAQQATKRLLSELPNIRAPRNFTLDPAVYGHQRPEPSFLATLYPQLRIASTVAALFLFMLVGYATLGNGIARSDQTVASRDLMLTESSNEMADIITPSSGFLNNSPSDFAEADAEDGFVILDLDEESIETGQADTQASMSESADAMETDLGEITSPRESDSIVRMADAEEAVDESLAEGSPLPEETASLQSNTPPPAATPSPMPTQAAPADSSSSNGDDAESEIVILPTNMNGADAESEVAVLSDDGLAAGSEIVTPNSELVAAPFWTQSLGLVIILLTLLTGLLFVLTWLSRNQRQL